ncbi:zinc finger protein 184-like [Xiphias gladius]|uniref:zinc finger protein 184-like n=1 Tax=Xiphias gladius TaxID=8245 RepID=UPI001A9827B3|nr:zinc finger protein 184-like [Xiphias gladius]
MCAVQLLRVSVHERISAAAEDFLLRVEKGEDAAEIPALRALLTERLTAAAEEIVGLFEETVAEYEDRVERSEREICRQRRLLDAVLKPEVRLHRAVCPADVQQLLVRKEISAEQEEWSSNLDQEDPPEPPHIKEEQEELWTGQEGEQLQGLEEADITKFTFTPDPVKSEDDDDDEEKPQSSQLHQNQTENRDSVGGEDCGGPEPARNSDPDRHLQPVSEDNSPASTETDDSDCDWTQSSEAQSGIEIVKNSEAPDTDIGSSMKERPFPCSYCGKRFSLKGNLNRHIRDHTGERPFPCTGCDKSFKDSGSLTAHMRCHTGEQPYSCLFCGKNFSGRGNMTRHMRIHTGEKPFTCSVCNKSFHVKEHLNRHMKYHTGEKPFSCSVCGKGCAQKTDLKKHMRVHTGEKPFSCPFCGKCCAEKGDLTKHMRVHTGEKPFSCNICGKSCAQKGSLKIHMRIHTGEKPFSCSVCGKCFTVTGHLKRHMKLHTADSQVTESADSYSGSTKSDSSKMSEPSEKRLQRLSLSSSPAEVAVRAPPSELSSTRNSVSLFTSPLALFVRWKPQTAQKRRKMCAVQLLRVSVHERISAAAEDFLLRVEKGEDAAEIPALRALLTERLTAAAEEIVGLFEETVAEYEDRVERSEREICRQRRLLDAVLKPEVRLHRADVQQQSVSKGKLPPERQKWSLDQEDQEPQHIKEEKEELWNSLEGKQLQGLEVPRFTFSPDPVKTEEDDDDDDDDEEKPQTSQLHQSQTETRDSVEGEDCGGSEQARNSDPDGHLEPISDDNSPDSTEVSDDDWKETGKLSGLKTLKNNRVPASDMRCSSGEKPFSCSECDKTFSYSYLLGRHMRTHTGEKPFICSFCGKRFSQKGNMVYHMGRHTGEKRFSCSVCDRRFTWLSGVKRHKCADDTFVSVGETEADGEDCGGPEPARNSDPDRHLQPDTKDKASESSETETEDSDGDWQKTRKLQSGHTGDAVNTNKKPLRCFRCGKMFGCKKTLLAHMRYHAAEKPFRCSVCEKRFSWSDSLQKHMKIHRGEKPFSCSVCGKTFIQKGNLQVHMRTHTGEKPFNCSICDKRFAQRSHLVDHMRCHTGEKPFSCSVCEKRFRFRGGVVRHMKIHMGQASQLQGLSQEIYSEVGTEIP